MKRLGTVLHAIDNLLIVRADQTLEKDVLYQNSIVVTKKMIRIGKIKELFGPVNSPYFSIKLFRDVQNSEIKKLRNERIYLQ
ncbi:MAG: H/ACA RNA-protein complex protein Gar1 [Candidatus Methanoperedens sp.]|nr:H/ACA RNA-protein complex protein Gar1 [Candidatus Methanoperedens sp.]MCE8425924.1 H/ACA RNA-protein complex protein Gar1 [Candidatus Methanoperedens sp.]MCE8427529.1 H/ACA RNA-protein complex protein Gar1 [Candidatus Methanoperedens sp.]